MSADQIAYVMQGDTVTLLAFAPGRGSQRTQGSNWHSVWSNVTIHSRNTSPSPSPSPCILPKDLLSLYSPSFPLLFIPPHPCIPVHLFYLPHPLFAQESLSLLQLIHLTVIISLVMARALHLWKNLQSESAQSQVQYNWTFVQRWPCKECTTKRASAKEGEDDDDDGDEDEHEVQREGLDTRSTLVFAGKVNINCSRLLRVNFAFQCQHS